MLFIMWSVVRSQFGSRFNCWIVETLWMRSVLLTCQQRVPVSNISTVILRTVSEANKKGTMFWSPQDISQRSSFPWSDVVRSNNNIMQDHLLCLDTINNGCLEANIVFLHVTNTHQPSSWNKRNAVFNIAFGGGQIAWQTILACFDLIEQFYSGESFN